MRYQANVRFPPIGDIAALVGFHHCADSMNTSPWSVMGRYLKKQVVVEAARWFKHGDHPAVIADSADNTIGYVDTPEGRLRVEPGDWIITGIVGENYPCKPDVFGRLYKPID